MPSYRLIPLSHENLRYLPAIARYKTGKDVLVYIPVLPVDPEADLDQGPIISEDA